MGHSKNENSVLNSRKLNVNVYFWAKQSSAFSQNSTAIVSLHQNYILYNDRISWNCNITRFIRITYTILSVITTGCWRPRQEIFLVSAAFLFNDWERVCRIHCHLARLIKNWNEFDFFQARKIDLWNKMRTEILIKELEGIKVWINRN